MKIYRLPRCHLPAGTLMLIREGISGPDRFCYVTPGAPGYEELAAAAYDGSHLVRPDFWPDVTTEKICHALRSLLDQYRPPSHGEATSHPSIAAVPDRVR